MFELFNVKEESWRIQQQEDIVTQFSSFLLKIYLKYEFWALQELFLESFNVKEDRSRI